MRARLKKLLIIAVSLFVLSLALNIAIDNPYTQRLVRYLITENLEKVTPFRLDYELIKISAVPISIDFFGVRVSYQGESLVSLTTASRIRVQLSIWSLILGDPKLGLIELRDPNLTWPLPDEVMANFLSKPADEELESKGPIK